MLYKSLVNSILLHGCETWILLADSEKRMQAFENKCMRKLLRISYLDHKTNNWVRSTINFLVGPEEPFLATVKRRKLAWFGYVTHRDSVSKAILQATLEGGRRRGRQRKCWMDKISGHPCPCQNCSQGPPSEKTGRGSLLNRPSCPLDNPISQGTELKLLDIFKSQFNREGHIRTKRSSSEV